MRRASRALVVATALRRVAIDAAVRIGVRNGPAGFEAHAWVEVGGVPVNEASEVVELFVAFEQPLSHEFTAAFR